MVMVPGDPANDIVCDHSANAGTDPLIADDPEARKKPTNDPGTDQDPGVAIESQIEENRAAIRAERGCGRNDCADGYFGHRPESRGSPAPNRQPRAKRAVRPRPNDKRSALISITGGDTPRRSALASCRSSKNEFALRCQGQVCRPVPGPGVPPQHRGGSPRCCRHPAAGCGQTLMQAANRAQPMSVGRPGRCRRHEQAPQISRPADVPVFHSLAATASSARRYPAAPNPAMIPSATSEM